MKIQLKRSNQLDGGSAKEPSLTYMEYGELAVNFNTADPAIFIKSSDGAGTDKIVRIAGSGAESGGMPDGPTADRPSSPSVGDLYFDTDLNAIVYWNGSAWQQISPSTIMYDGTNDAPPTTYPVGTLWFNTSETEAALYVLYEDTLAAAQGKIWVQVAGGGGGGGDSAEVIVSDGAPVFGNLPEGTLWWDSSDDGGQLYILYIDPDAQKHWVPANPTGDTGALDERYVELNPEGGASQNVSGPITIGPEGGPAVTTLADNGNAEFAGKIDVGEYTTGDGVTIRNGGSVRIKRNNSVISAALNIQDQNGSNGAWFNDGVLGMGSDIKVDCNTLLYPSGAAEFAAGNVNIRANDGRISIGDYNNEVSTALYKGNLSLVQTNQSESVFGAFNATNSTTPVIDFKADGSASFAGLVSTGDFDNTAAGVKVHQSGFVHVRKDGGSNALAVWNGAGGTPTASINPNGSAHFAGTVETDANVFAGAAIVSTRFGVTSQMASEETINGQTKQLAFAVKNATPTYRVTLDYSGNLALGDNAWETPNIYLKGSDGSATFADTVSAPFISLAAPNANLQPNHNVIFFEREAGNWGNVGAKFGGILAKTGSDNAASIDIVRGSASYGNSSDIVFNTHGGGGGNPTEMARFTYDGTANFAKKVTVDKVTTNAGERLFQLISDIGGDNTTQFSVFANGNTYIGPVGSETIKLNADGSANFVGEVLTSSLGSRVGFFGGAEAGDYNTRCDINGLVGETRGQTPNLPVRFPSGTQGATGRNLEVFGGLQINTEPDNPANYTTTTDAEGNETQVYNGPTLDVKERLQNLVSRLDALESDEIADDATSTLLLTTVNTLNSQMAKVNFALTAIRAAANVAGTLEELKSEIVTATADI